MPETDVAVVLAHGGWADGSSWNKVIAGLRSEGVKAVAAPLPMTSLADDVTGQLPDGTTLPLFRLRYAGSASTWGFAIYRASHDDYETSVLPSGHPAGTPQEALDCACGLYLGDHTAWLAQQPDELTGAHYFHLAPSA